ncbi:MAG: S41 family peptidase [Rikenellaceae bacterium]
MNKDKKVLTFLIAGMVMVAFLGYSFGVIMERREVGNVMELVNNYINKQGRSTTLGEVMAIVDGNYVDSVNFDTLSEKMIPLLLKELDPHSSFIPAREVLASQESLRGDFDGIGVMFNMLTDTVIIQDVIPGGPSSKVGIISGDRIIKINDTIVAGKKINSNLIVGKLKGKGGTAVKVGIKRKGVKELIDINIVRGKVEIKSVDASFMITPQIGYVKLLRFSLTTHQELKDAIKALKAKGMKSLILDLQSNGGGYLDQAILIANEFLPKGKMIVYTEGRGKRLTEQYADGTGEFIGDDITILINEVSASASEIVSGALQDNDIGTIVGRRSFGKGLVQQQIDLSDGSLLLLTIARYHTPTGRCIQRPYDKGEEEYYGDIENRYLHGEMVTKDSIKQNHSLRYTTPKGKVVYGGGGIMPDVFVPADTSRYSQFEIKALSGIYRIRYVSEYVDKNRRTLERISTKAEFDRYFDKNKDLIYNGYKRYFFQNEKERGAASEWTKIEKDLKILFKASIGDATKLKTNAFYIYMSDYDEIIKQGLAVTKEKLRKR